MAEFYVSDNKIYMDDGTVSLHIADLRPELTETLKAEVAENLEVNSAPCMTIWIDAENRRKKWLKNTL